MSQWMELTALNEWQDVLKRSAEHPVLIMKHSTTCPISAAAWSACNQYAESRTDGPELVYVKVIESRPVSNQIAADLGVQHASPQTILVVNGKPVWHTSHYNITVANLSEAVSAANA